MIIFTYLKALASAIDIILIKKNKLLKILPYEIIVYPSKI